MKKKRITAALLALGLSTVTVLSQLPVLAAEETAAEAQVQATADPSVVITNGIDGWPQASDISSTAAIVMETSNNTVLYSKNADQALYPASAVKVMTCLLALENSNLDDQVTMTATGVSGVTDGGANISSQLDEVFTMEQSQQAVNEHVTSVSFAFPYCQSLFSVCKKIITQHQESGGYQTHRYQPGCGYAFVLKHILAAYTGYTPENSPCNRYDGACYHPVFLCTILFILLWVHKICSPAIYFSF